MQIDEVVSFYRKRSYPCLIASEALRGSERNNDHGSEFNNDHSITLKQKECRCSPVVRRLKHKPNLVNPTIEMLSDQCRDRLAANMLQDDCLKFNMADVVCKLCIQNILIIFPRACSYIHARSKCIPGPNVV